MSNLLVVPEIQREGMDAARIGTHMSDFTTPLGFCFCPYPDESVERANWVGGAVHFYMGPSEPLTGEML